MYVAFRPQPFRDVLSGLPLALAILLVLSAGMASAADVTVDCTALGSSINAALALLDKTVPNRVNISGTCIESVVVDGFKNLVLWGEPGAVIQQPTLADPSGEAPALHVKGSENIDIHGLIFQGPGIFSWSPPLVRIYRSSGVGINNCTIQGSRSTGLEIQDSRGVGSWTNLTIQDNKGSGLSASGASSVNLALWNTDTPYQVRIRRNGTGITASGGARVDVGNATIQDNQGEGVVASNAAWVNLGCWDPLVPTLVQGNGSGGDLWTPAVMATDSGVVWLILNVTIRNNRGCGAAAWMGRLVVCCGEGTSITDNGSFGIAAFMGGEVDLWSPGLLVEGNRYGGVILASSRGRLVSGAVIRENGDPTDANSIGGISAGANSTIDVLATVADNYGPGVVVSGAATASFYENTEITGNNGYGVLLEMNSTALFSDNNNVTGNKQFDLVCTSGSVAGAAKGQHPTIGKMKCADWAQLGPPPAWAEPTAQSAQRLLSRPSKWR